MNAAMPPLSRGGSSRAAILLGFALGGFFDGILLHQVLQWHHLLSGLEGETWRDIRVQILADGVFHLLMYVLAAIGLWLLWRHRHDAAARSGRRLAASLLLGFGIWHIADIALVHWILGLHRIRMAVETPLLWDLLWLAVFGIAAVAAGLWLRARAGADPGGGGAHPIPAMLLAGIVASAAVSASLPLPATATPDGRTPLLVWFLPGTAPAEIFAAIDALDGRTVWSDASGEVYLIAAGGDLSLWDRRLWPLYRHNALPVSSSVFPAACFRAMRLT